MRSRPKATNWFRFALKLGLLATDASVWMAMNRLLTEREDASPMRPRDEVARQLQRRHPRSRMRTLLMGIGVGVGIGMLFAPVSGEEARGAIRDKAEDVRDKWNDVAAWAGLGPSSMRRSTGTYAD